MSDPTPPTRAVQEFHFRDRRPPQEIQWRLEADLMELVAPVAGSVRYTLQTTMRHGTQQFVFHLIFQAALANANCYSFRAELSDPGPRPSTPEELTRTITSWMGFWMRDYAAADPPGAAEGSAARYEQLVQAARTAESHLVDVPSVQQEIIRRMRTGAEFRTAHKEGGTTISFRGGRWSRVDYGEWSTTEHFQVEAQFLSFLRTFFDVEVSRNILPDRVPDEKAWRLILRLLRDGGGAANAVVRQVSPAVVVWAMVTATSFILAGAKVRIALRGRTPVPSIDALFYPSLGVLGLCVLVAAVWLRRNWQ